VAPARFVWVDECGSHTSLTSLYARAPKGQRAHGRVPRNHGPNTTLLASLTLEGMGPAATLEGAVDSLTFAAYVEQVLAPTLRPDDIVVLDNLSAHQSGRARQAVEARGAQLWFLPAYSPDLSPIEEAFAKVKGLLRRAEARTREALEAALAQALEAITAQDARGFFGHCGYLPQAQPS
jgi:transposase